ncbi:MAG: hypothetical protein HQL50_08625 [Magnetococcales bacterium]|nr:hypothetical protein [Magnetococcales bacterium]
MSDTPSTLTDHIHTLLTTPRALSIRQMGNLAVMCDCDDPLADFSRLPLREVMESDELDLFFAAMFTPTLDERKSCQPHLPAAGLDGETVTAIRDSLLGRCPICPIIGAGENGGLTIPETLVERFVELLALDHPATATAPIKRLIPDTDQHNHALTLLRKPVWNNSASATILNQWLDALAAEEKTEPFSVDKLAFFTEFIAVNHPRSLQACYSMLEQFQEECKSELHTYHDEAHEHSDVRARHLSADYKTFRLKVSAQLLRELKPLL